MKRIPIKHLSKKEQKEVLKEVRQCMSIGGNVEVGSS